MKKKVARLCLGAAVYDVCVREGSGGEGYMPGKKNPYCRIVVGVGGKDDEQVYGTLLHEAQEVYLCSMQRSFEPDYKASSDSCNKLFVFDHSFFTEMCDDVAGFMIVAWPCVRKAWVEFHKKKGKADV